MKKRLLLNTFTTFLFELVYISYGFIVPRFILKTYGSEVNGLITSINQFLAIISFGEFGITTVVQSALYKPLANHDFDFASNIISSASKFFKRIGIVFAIYIIGLCIIYPIIINSDFQIWYVSSLILILGINTFVEYMFGICNTQLISASQNIYVLQISRTVSYIIVILITTLLIYLKASIHILKLSVAIILLVNPLVAQAYVKHSYPNISKTKKVTEEPIKQKWNGVSQHISLYVFNSTDIILLTIFSSLSSVSVYSVYNIVISGLKKLSEMVVNSFKPALGELWIKKDKAIFTDYFYLYEWLMNTISMLIFGCTSNLIVAFTMIYTRGINEVNYRQTVFAIIISIACCIQVKNSYHTLVQSVNEYKSTQNCYAISALINIIISLCLVKPLSIVGVGIGTMIASIYQTVWLMNFSYKHILCKSRKRMAMILTTDVITFFLGFTISSLINVNETSYLSWTLSAIEVFMIWLTVIILISFLFYKKEFKKMLNLLIKQ